MQRSYEIFNESIRSEATRKTHKFYLNKFLEFSKIKDYDSLVSIDNKLLETILIDYVIYLKKKVEAKIITPNAFSKRFDPIELFMIQNDKILNFKKIKRMFPRKQKRRGELPYTREDIQKFLKSSNSIRTDAVILFFSSTGVRPESLVDLKLRHYKQMDENCGTVLIYENDPEEYPVFLTPESSDSLKKYLKHREENGEKLNQESPLFRNDFREKMSWFKIKPITNIMLVRLMRKILVKSKLQTTLERGEKRHHKALYGAYRKWFETILNNINNFNPNITEKLMGHRNDLRGTYYNPNLQTRFNEFKKAIPELIIDDSIRLEEQNRFKEERIKKLESEKDIRMSNLENVVSELTKRLDSKLDS